MTVRVALVLGLLSLTAPLGLRAQRLVRGVAFDSLRTMRPIAGATVRVLGSTVSAITDEQGRFALVDAPRAAFEVGFWAHWLDSLGLPALRVPVPEDDGATPASIAISTPSVATYQQARCGVALDTGLAVIVGEVRDAFGRTFERIEVRGSWVETRVASGRIAQEQIAVVDTTTASGAYTLCGAPIATRIRVAAAGSAAASDAVTIDVASDVLSHHIVVSSEAERMRVLGRVLSDSGLAIAGATVSLASDSTIAARTSDSGAFTLTSVPRRSTEFRVRALGFTPASVRVEPRDSTVILDDLRLERLPQDLGTVLIPGSPYDYERLGFEERRRGAAGTFVTDSMLARLPVVTISAFASLSTMLRVQVNNRFPELRIRYGYGFCAPRFFVDGLDEGRLDTRERSPEQAELLRRAKRVEIYSAADAPPQFNDNDGCGSIVIWTR